MYKISRKAYVAAAQRIHYDAGVVEVDDDARISRGTDPGVYVQAWVWVYDEDVTLKEQTDHA